MESNSQHQVPSLQCHFCEKSHASANALHKHLNRCANQTDECPKCRQLIKRSSFANHYNNNCASSLDSNTPIRKKTDSDQDSGHLYRSNANQNNRSKSVTIDEAFRPIERRSNDAVCVPCEFCNELVDVVQWALHTQDCREKKDRRRPAREEVAHADDDCHRRDPKRKSFVDDTIPVSTSSQSQRLHQAQSVSAYMPTALDKDIRSARSQPTNKENQSANGSVESLGNVRKHATLNAHVAKHLASQEKQVGSEQASTRQLKDGKSS